MKAVTEAPSIGSNASLYQSAAAAYLESVNKGKSALLVSPTWNEIEAVTEQVRHTLKAQARLGVQEHSVTVLDSLAWTDAQKKNVHQYELGQKILFPRDSGAFAKNEAVEVVAVRKHLRVKRSDGSEVEFNPAKISGSTVDVCQPHELKVSRGDKLLLHANHRESKLINGELVEVQEIQSGGEIRLADGRTLPKEYRRFCHGYAVTSHASQGKTVDDVFLVASSHSFGAVNREQFYVSISRGRERCHVFTDDAELLQRRIGDSHERTAAVELVKLREALAANGYTPRPDVAVRQHPQLKEKESPRVRAVRPVRLTRQWLSVPQRLAKMARDFKDWTQRKIEPAVEQQKQIRRSQSRGISI